MKPLLLTVLLTLTLAAPAAAARDRLEVANVIGDPSLQALGVRGLHTVEVGPGDGPRVVCQRRGLASLPGAQRAFFSNISTEPDGSGASVREAVVELGTHAQTRSVRQLLVRRWAAGCTSWEGKTNLWGPKLERRRDLALTRGKATVWHVGGTDHQAGTVNGWFAVIKVGRRVAMLHSFVPQFTKRRRADALVRRAATVLGR